MPITLGSSGITFSNGTSQTTAMPADKGKPISVTSFTSSGTYTVPSGCTMILVQLVGGGGGSAGYNESGGAGGFAEGYYSVSAGATYSVTIGGGGGGVGYYAGAGNGGTTSFGSLLSASGGHGANTNYSHGGGHGGNSFGGQSFGVVGGSGSGHGNSASHGQPSGGGASFFGGPGGQYRSTTPSNYSPAYGTGATGGRTNDGGSGTTGMSGCCVIFAYT